MADFVTKTFAVTGAFILIFGIIMSLWWCWHLLKQVRRNKK